MTTAERLTTVIPTYREPHLLRTVEALVDQTVPPDSIVIVNNDPEGALRLESLSDSSVPVYAIDEPRKGTGTASATGFRYAIDKLGASIVSRTDADGIPRNNWTETIRDKFGQNPDIQLLAGPSVPLRDEYFRRADVLGWPLFWKVFKGGVSLAARNRGIMRIAPGCNMAIRSEAYDMVGGFANTSIQEADEDVELSLAVYKMLGLDAMAYDSNMKVETSLRRLRRVGYVGLVKYYIRPDAAYRQRASGGEVDIR